MAPVHVGDREGNGASVTAGVLPSSLLPALAGAGGDLSARRSAMWPLLPSDDCPIYLDPRSERRKAQLASPLRVPYGARDVEAREVGWIRLPSR